MTSLIDTATCESGWRRVWNGRRIPAAFLRQFLFAASEYRSAAILELHRCDVATKAISKIDLGWERGLGSPADRRSE